ncbi:MAG: dihydrodipicolinate synthase family protein [Thermomicrobiales bacterium]|nr:dihydrodipicolinate synthase family protein [Thermomicrobiales bacterium]
MSDAQMTPDELKSHLRGVLAFAPTPFTAAGAVDFDGLASQVDRLSQSGASVVVIGGAVGEFFSLTREEYRECMRVAVDAVAGRVPLMAGIGHSTIIACDLAAYAASAGVDGLMINPLYMATPTIDGWYRHYAELGRASGLGMMIFSTVGSVYSAAMVERLAEIDEVIALKDEFGDLKLFAEIRDRVGGRLAMVNGMAEELAGPYFAAGASAFTSGVINFAPQVSLAIHQAGIDENWQDVHRLVDVAIRPIAQLRARKPGYMIAVIKEAMNILGLPGGHMRLPLEPVAPADRAELETVLRQISELAA